MLEEWKVCEIGDYRFIVSNFGNVCNWHTKKNMYLQPDRLGYLTVKQQVKLKIKTFKVHRLVAYSFITNPENKPCVNHKDGVKFNNLVSNLEWNTYRENSQHAHDTGLVSRKGSKNSRATTDEATVHKICQWYQDNPRCGAKEAQSVFEISLKILTKIRCGESWKHVRHLYTIPPLTSRAKFID